MKGGPWGKGTNCRVGMARLILIAGLFANHNPVWNPHVTGHGDIVAVDLKVGWEAEPSEGFVAIHGLTPVVRGVRGKGKYKKRMPEAKRIHKRRSHE